MSSSPAFSFGPPRRTNTFIFCARNLGAIIDELATRFNAPRALIAGDVATMLRDLGDKGVVRW